MLLQVLSFDNIIKTKPSVDDASKKYLCYLFCIRYYFHDSYRVYLLVPQSMMIEENITFKCKTIASFPPQECR